MNGPISFDIIANDSGPMGWQMGFGVGEAYDVHSIKTYTYNSPVWETLNPVKRIAKWIQEN